MAAPPRPAPRHALRPRLTSAAPLLARLRGHKSPAELARIRRAVAVTEEVVGLLTPGVGERQLADSVHAEFRRRGLRPAWGWNSCPIVSVGPEPEPGHASPRYDLRVDPGHLVHVDLGVRLDGFCSELQRMWYVRRAGEAAPPEDIRRAFDAVAGAVETRAAALRPGALGHEVAAARRVVVGASYPELKHGLGHGLGRAVHDGGTLLGPRWPCYGATTEGMVEAGNVFTLEQDVPTTAGFVGVEEDVLVTAQGCTFLSSFQRPPSWSEGLTGGRSALRGQRATGGGLQSIIKGRPRDKAVKSDSLNGFV